MSVRERPILFSGPMVRAILDGRKMQTRRPVGAWISSNFAYVEPLPESVAGERGPTEFPGRQPGDFLFHNGIPIRDLEWQPVSCPVARPGERLWVRETWRAACLPSSSPGWLRAGERLWVRETWRGWFPLDAAKQPIDSWHVRYRADGVELVTDCAWDEGPLYLSPEDCDLDVEPARWRPSIHMPRWASRLTLEVTGVRVERLQEISGEDARAEGIEQPRCSCDVCHMTSAMCTADADSHVAEFASLWDGLYGSRPGCSWADNPWVWVVEFRKLDAQPSGAAP